MAKTPQPVADPADGSAHMRRRFALSWLARKAGVYLMIGYIVWCAGLFIRQDAMIFPRHVAAKPFAALPDPDTIVVTLDIEGGGRGVGWLKLAPGASPGNPKPVVMFFHGNAEIIDENIGIPDPYHDLGCSVFLPEYRGYGRSSGTPSEEAIREDCMRFYDELVKRPEVDASRIVLHGRSLGGGVAAGLAARRKPAALILESTFYSVQSFAAHYLAPGFLVRHPFRTDKAVEALDVPILIFHGRKDEIIPVSHGRRLSRLAASATYVEYDCGHLELAQGDRERPYWDEIAMFLTRASVIGRNSAATAPAAR